MKRILFVIAFLGALAAFGNEGWVKLYKLTQREKALEAENRLIADHNLEMEFEIQHLQDPKFLERYIRREMGFVRDNEMVYELVDGSAKR